MEKLEWTFDVHDERNLGADGFGLIQVVAETYIGPKLYMLFQNDDDGILCLANMPEAGTYPDVMAILNYLGLEFDEEKDFREDYLLGTTQFYKDLLAEAQEAFDEYLKSEDYMLKTEQLNKEILLQSQEAEAEEEYLESEEENEEV